jgi:hypothetical protein
MIKVNKKYINFNRIDKIYDKLREYYCNLDKNKLHLSFILYYNLDSKNNFNNFISF